MDSQTLIFIKENLTGLHYLVGISSFLIGVSPLFTEREKVQKQANVFYIEISAAIFLLFTLSMFTLDYLSGIPIFTETNCIQIKNNYIKDIPFNELIKNNQGLFKIKQISSNHYLVYHFNTRNFTALEITEDFKYQQIKCIN